MDTAARLLRVLSLLQTRPAWTSEELALRLGQHEQTLRSQPGVHLGHAAELYFSVLHSGRFVRFLQEASRSGKALGSYQEHALPLRWIPEKMRRYIYGMDERNRRKVLPDRYEFLLYRHLRHGLEAGDVFCRDSVRFRSMKDDLIDDKQWQDKDRLIVEAGLDILQQPIEKHLKGLEEQLETRIAEVNRRIAAGENKHFKIKPGVPRARWTLPNHVGARCGVASARAPARGSGRRRYA